MRTIYKYTLKVEGEQQLPLPRGSQLRSAIEQNGEIVCYAEVDQQEQQTELHTFHVYGTGHTIRHNGGGSRFLDTVKLGALVFHVFHQPPQRA